jgi:hypothetical protein
VAIDETPEPRHPMSGTIPAYEHVRKHFRYFPVLAKVCNGSDGPRMRYDANVGSWHL